MLAPAAVAGLAAVVAGAQRQVAAHAGCDEGQRQQRQPAQAELLVGRVARARVREVPLRVRHTVVQHALGAQHAADFVDALLDRVGRVLALSPPVVLVVEHLSTVNAARALAVLPPPPALRLGERRGLSLDGGVLAQAQPEARSDAHAGSGEAVAAGAVKEILALLTVQFVKRGGEVHVLSVGLVSAHDRVAVVLVASDENVLPRVDADDLLFVHAEADSASRLEGNRQKREKLIKNKTYLYTVTLKRISPASLRGGYLSYHLLSFIETNF